MSTDTGHKNQHEPSALPPQETAGDGSNPLEQSAAEFPIVGIGASAGGLTAFEQLFTALPPEPGMAFVVVQHLSPPHKSILPEILRRYTAMPVDQVTGSVQVQPNTVYVIPPGSDLALRDGRLMLQKPEATRGYRLPIDFFFRSLAQDQGARAIGIVLSGTGSDGSLGLRTIKAEGGLTIAQEPETAAYADMPRNAIATKEVDFILPPEKMGDLILKFIHHQVLEGYKRSESDFDIPVGGLEKLYYLLRAKTGHDFSLYKQNTLMRRIERRMKVALVKNLDEYIDRLEEHPPEIAALFQEMLINVTSFFREPEAFHALVEKAIHPLIVMRHAANTPLRIWVAGCSSGEEAYSIAIAVQEQIEALKVDCKVQIYATDLDADAILAARRGFYSDGSLENVSAERLQRFFNPEDEGYQIKKTIRDRVVFSTQNLISDPPFSKIDLVCCRNVLIYLERELQNQLFLQFHYSLNPDGILFLGNSESIGENRNLFTVIDRKHKIFQRNETVTQRRVKTQPRSIPHRVTQPDTAARSDRLVTGGLREWTERALLDFHAPACVVIDQKHNILFVHGRTGKYLEPVAGETNVNIIRMAREGLKTELATAIHALITHKEPVRREGVLVKTNGDYQAINLTVRLVEGPQDFSSLIMVVFEEAQILPQNETPAAAPRSARTVEPRRVSQLKQELKQKDEYLHTIINDLEETNQDLKATNEELQSANEEMQSTNEELETSKEELQSINEELNTINGELQNKNQELYGVSNDIYNLLASVDIGMIFLDQDLHIRRYTPAVNRIYNFLPADVGRPIGHFVSNLKYDHLIADIHQVLRDLTPKSIEAQTRDGTWYLIHIKPYRTLENVIDGVVISLVDISEQKHGDALRRMGTILRDSNDAVTLQDFYGKIQAWNRGAARMYGWTEAEALAMNALDMIPENKRKEVMALYKRLAEGETILSFETQRVTRDGRILDVWLTLTSLVNDANQPVAIATTERDITDRNRSSQQLSFENRALKALNNWHQILFERPDHPSLTEEACRILVEDAGYRMAWIGKVDQDNAATVTPVTWAGSFGGRPDPLPGSVLALVKSALTSGHPVSARNVLNDQTQEIGSADALKHHYRSILALPVLNKKSRLGILVIYASEAEAFIDAEVECLRLLSTRIARALGPDLEELRSKGTIT